MVDCFGRSAVQMTEIPLEPVQMMKQRAGLSSVSLRTPSGGRRFLVTIAKRYPDGERAAPAYVWSVDEITPQGEPMEEGVSASSEPGAVFREPEDAYWAAVDGLCAFTEGR